MGPWSICRGWLTIALTKKRVPVGSSLIAFFTWMARSLWTLLVVGQIKPVASQKRRVTLKLNASQGAPRKLHCWFLKNSDGENSGVRVRTVEDVVVTGSDLLLIFGSSSKRSCRV